MKRGFTLIELLVVVLIIGILSAVALPMYQKAVLKAKASKALIYTKQLADAVEIYYLNNGTYPKYFSDLEVDFSTIFPRKPATSELDQYSGGVTSREVLANDDMELILYCGTYYSGICASMTRIRDTNPKYSGSGFAYIHKLREGYQQYEKTTVCHETSLRGLTHFCRQVMGLKNVKDLGIRVLEQSYPL